MVLPRPERSSTRWYVVLTVFLLSFITIVDRVCISAAKSAMSADLGIDNIGFGVVFGAFALGYAVLMVPSGWFADRFGPRRFLALIVTSWSLFTLITGTVSALPVLIAVRFAFGLAEAGAYPTATRAIYSWFPISERGLALGILNSGSRIGAAFGLAVMSLSVMHLGWRTSFYLLGVLGFAWAAWWLAWFRDDPREKRSVSEAELDYIAAGRAAQPALIRQPVPWKGLLLSRNFYLILGQYFASNFTFFICFSWLLPYVQERYALNAAQAGLYASVPLYCGACATWLGGVVVDSIYRRGHWRLSRALPPVFGFGLAAVCLVAGGYMQTPASFTVCFALATFGVDLAIAPSWTVASDVGGRFTGTLSGAMNMAGSLGSFSSSVAFPYMLKVTGSVQSYFMLAAALNVAAIVCWCGIRPERALEPRKRMDLPPHV